MADPIFDHEKLAVYRLALEYVAEAFRLAGDLSGLHRHSRDQWLRAAQSIPLNVAEGNGKRSLRDRSRFFDIARGSALECAAIQEVLVISGGMTAETSGPLKGKLKRIVAMRTRLRCDQTVFPRTPHATITPWSITSTITSTSTSEGRANSRFEPEPSDAPKSPVGRELES